MYKVISLNLFSIFKKDWPGLDYKDCDLELKEAKFIGKYKFPNNVLFEGHAYDYGAYSLGVGVCYLENDSKHKLYGVYKIETGGIVSPLLNGYNVCAIRDNKFNNKYYQQVQRSHIIGMPNAWFSNNFPRMTKCVVFFDANTREVKTAIIEGLATRTLDKVQFVDEVTEIKEYNSKARKDHLMITTKKGPAKESKLVGEVTEIQLYNSNARKDHLMTITKKGKFKDSKLQGELTVIEEYNTKAREDHLMTVTKKGPSKESKFEGEVTVIEEYNTKAREDHLMTKTLKGTAKDSKFVGDVEETRAYSDQVDNSSFGTTSASSDSSSQKRGLDLLCDAINQSPKRPKLY